MDGISAVRRSTVDFIQCTKCGKTIKPYEKHKCLIADHAVLGEVITELKGEDKMDKFKLKDNVSGRQLCITMANENLLHLQIIDNDLLNTQYFISRAEFERIIKFVEKS